MIYMTVLNALQASSRLRDGRQENYLFIDRDRLMTCASI